VIPRARDVEQLLGGAAEALRRARDRSVALEPVRRGVAPLRGRVELAVDAVLAVDARHELRPQGFVLVAGFVVVELPVDEEPFGGVVLDAQLHVEVVVRPDRTR